MNIQLKKVIQKNEGVFDVLYVIYDQKQYGKYENRTVNLYELIEFAEDAAKHGLYTDMNPTLGGIIHMPTTEDGRELHSELTQYYRRAEQRLRERANKVLGKC
jgi:hypothetical protein